MYKSLALFAAGTQASLSDFPSFSSLHAHCELKASFAQSCADLYSSVEQAISSDADGGPSKGLYAIKETGSNEYIWATRTTPVKHYQDNIVFQFSGTGTACQIDARSQSESLSYYDYDTNYCNMWNIFNQANSTFTGLSDSHCNFPAKNPTTTCAKY